MSEPKCRSGLRGDRGFLFGNKIDKGDAFPWTSRNRASRTPKSYMTHAHRRHLRGSARIEPRIIVRHLRQANQRAEQAFSKIACEPSH